MTFHALPVLDSASFPVVKCLRSGPKPLGFVIPKCHVASTAHTRVSSLENDRLRRSSFTVMDINVCHMHSGAERHDDEEKEFANIT